MLSWIPAALNRPELFIPSAARSIVRTGLSDGWVGDYLRDPGGALFTLLGDLRAWAITWGPVVGPVLGVVVAGFAIGRRWWARRCHARLLAGARQVTVLAPPSVDPAGGAALWSNLVGLLRPAWRRWFTGQPHVACEYC